MAGAMNWPTGDERGLEFGMRILYRGEKLVRFLFLQLRLQQKVIFGCQSQSATTFAIFRSLHWFLTLRSENSSQFPSLVLSPDQEPLTRFDSLTLG